MTLLKYTKKVCGEVQRIVASVKELRFNMSRKTNGSEGTVSKKTQILSPYYTKE